MILKSIIGTIILSVWGICSFGQSQTDKYLVDSLNDLSYDFAYSDPDKAFKIGQNAYKLAKSSKYLPGEITSLLRLGNIKYGLSDLDSATFYYNIAQSRFLAGSVDSIYLAKIYIYQASVDKSNLKNAEAIAKNYAAYLIAKKVKNKSVEVDALSQIGNIYTQLGNYEMALKSFHKIIEDYDTLDSYQKGGTHNNLGNIYFDEKRFDQALENYKLAFVDFQQGNFNQSSTKALINIGNVFVELGDEDSALFYFNYAEKNNAGIFANVEALIALNKGALLMRQNSLDSAEFYLMKSKTLKQTTNSLDDLYIINQNLGDIKFIHEDFEGALAYYLEADSLIIIAGDLAQQKIISQKLAAVYQELGDNQKTIEYLNRSNLFLDSLSTAYNNALIYEINYNKEKNKVSKLELILKNERLELDKKNTLIWSISLCSILGFIVLFILYRLSKQRRKALQQEKENLEAKQKITELINNKEKEAMSAMYDGQEKERNRISLELHDKLGAILSTVKLYFKSIDGQINQLKAENIKQYHKASNLLDEACDETRKIAHQLSSKNLGRIGLFATVKLFQTQIQDSGQMKFTFTTHGDDSKLGGLNQTSIYRIIQELVNNIMKHAHATEINLQLNVFEELFNLVIEDDGIGFDINNLIDNHGMGLKESEIRVKTMGGIQVIDSGRGGGTTITIDIPLNKKEK
jgi:two-component system NarL family sensor kinase